MQLRHFVEFQRELAINYCKLVVASVDAPEVNVVFRTGTGMGQARKVNFLEAGSFMGKPYPKAW